MTTTQTRLAAFIAARERMTGVDPDIITASDGAILRLSDLREAAAALSAVAPPPVLEGTPSSRWSANGEPDPHGNRYECERAMLACGHMTDDELANAVYLDPCIVNLTAAKDRIRWLSRKLSASPAAPAQPAMQAAPVAWQRMDSAPRDGTYILACDDDSHAVVYWMAGADAGWVYAWHEYDGPLLMHSAKFWQALPPPPTGE